VLVRIRCNLSGATTCPTILLGVMAHTGGAVVARQCPIGGLGTFTPGTATNIGQEALFTVTGLSGAYQWDAGYAVQVLLAATNIHWGGPNDTTTTNAWGGFIYEIWEAPNLLGSILYDPAIAVSKAATSNLAMTALDTTHLRLTFTAPASGNVMVRMRGVLHGGTTIPQILLGVLDGSTVRARTVPLGAPKTTSAATGQLAVEGQAVVTGLTPNASYTWDAAYGVEVVGTAAATLKYGGPNDNAGNDAYGGFLFEVWSV
jgi:hypothetical protein